MIYTVIFLLGMAVGFYIAEEIFRNKETPDAKD